MRVLLISHTCQSRTEGQPKARLLAAEPGIELKVLIPDRWRHYGRWRAADRPLPRQFDAEIARVSRPWAGPAQSYLHSYPGLARLLREFRPDVIDLWEEPWSLVSVQACRLRARVVPNARIVTETEQNIDKTLPFPFEQFRRYTLRHADFAVGRNREAVEILRRKGFVGPAQVVPNAVDAEVFRPMDRAACRAGLGLQGFVVGYVGRLVAEKGLTDLVDALPLCSPDVNLLLVGSGPLADDLLGRAQRMGLSARVRILPARPQCELPAVMNAVDALALVSRTTPSWKEQFGRVIIEAQACGTPVIGSDSGAIPDVVGAGGVIVPEGSPGAIAEAVARIAGSPEHAREMSREGRAAVESRYTWQRVAEAMAAIYRSAVGAGPTLA